MMPVDYVISAKQAILTLTGKVAQRDIEQALRNVVHNPVFTRGFRILVYDNNSSYNPTTFDIVSASHFIDSLVKSYSPKIALVVTKGLKYGFGRMLEMYCNLKKIRLRVFTEMDIAQKWLEGD
jgi:hypothetical protein